MIFRLADSDTGKPFKIKRAKKVSARKSLFAALCRRLGWKAGADPESNMKKVKMRVPCIAGGKARRKGEEVTLTDMKAAELVAMKVADVVGEVENPKVQPWDKPPRGTNATHPQPRPKPLRGPVPAPAR
jgi:hypothetical protein